MSHLENAKSVGLPYRAEVDASVNPRDLEEFHDRHARDTWWARVVLITLIFGMQGLNLWMTQRNYDAMIIDVDASRQAASQIDEQTTLRLETLSRRLESMQAQLASVAPTPATQISP